ncbi:MAG: DUF2207 domain-containing protein [Thiobacillus sp.]|nr:DUF2207 domain-containing protein [Thiobacillus sp.]
MVRRALLFFAMLLAASVAQSKSLYWPAIEVEAHLDADGRLHVVETQAYIFDGDWNGGERTFNIRAGQSLQLDGVDRVDGANSTPLTRGNLDVVDGYDMVDGSTLRWRSRLPEDPPFENTPLTYRIRYTLSGILSGRDHHFTLAHDFAFPDRQGVIQAFKLHFTIDPIWRGLDSPQQIELHDIPPGQGVIVRGELAYQGTTEPGAVVVPPPPWLGNVFLAVLAGGLVALLLRFLVSEYKLGRIGGLTPLDAIDQAWLDQTVFALRPEVVGAAWDGDVGAPEVAAILATLAHEKKIETSVERRFLRKAKLSMRLLVDLDSLDGYRHALLKKLFFDGRTETDTDAVQDHYRKSGLDLAGLIREPVELQLERLPDWSVKNERTNWRFDALALLAALVLLVVAAFLGYGNDVMCVISVIFGGLFMLPLGAVVARFHTRAVAGLAWRIPMVLVVAAPLVAETAYFMLNATDYLLHALTLAALAVWNLAGFNLILDALRTDETPEKIAARKKLYSARAYFKRELRSRTPRLDDDWFPYLLAFGLGSNVDSWFRAYGTKGGGTGPLTSLDNTSSGGSRGSSWTGGGGGFGGAGATGVWASAAVAVGAGVSSPSSSSSGGSSGGGGSSSGGGGGGGW